MRNVPPGFVECLENARPLDFSHGLLKGCSLLGSGRDRLITLPSRCWSFSRNRKLERLRRKEASVREQGDALHEVRKFPHVPRPPIGEEGRSRILGERFRRQPVVGTGPRQKV